jgi:hypothetical protein
MSDPDSYYTRNKQARKEYQRQYYHNNRQKILRKMELRRHLEPDKTEELKKYNRDYYLKNRERILARRREKYRAQKEALETVTKMKEESKPLA